MITLPEEFPYEVNRDSRQAFSVMAAAYAGRSEDTVMWGNLVFGISNLIFYQVISFGYAPSSVKGLVWYFEADRSMGETFPNSAL